MLLCLGIRMLLGGRPGHTGPSAALSVVGSAWPLVPQVGAEVGL